VTLNYQAAFVGHQDSLSVQVQRAGGETLFSRDYKVTTTG
jgi:hypothetical protein